MADIAATGASAASATIQAAADTAMWIGVLYGAIASLLITVGVFVVDKLFGDYWYALSFYRPKYQQNLVGHGVRIYGLAGKSHDGKAETVERLEAMFPAPGITDGQTYAITSAKLQTKRNNDAHFSCNLEWDAKGKKWSGKLKGRGRFFPKANDQNFVGYAYLVCEGIATAANAKETWSVTYVLRTKPTFDGWDGFWVMIDSYDAGKAKFGRIDLAND